MGCPLDAARSNRFLVFGVTGRTTKTTNLYAGPHGFTAKSLWEPPPLPRRSLGGGASYWVYGSVCASLRIYLRIEHRKGPMFTEVLTHLRMNTPGRHPPYPRSRFEVQRFKVPLPRHRSRVISTYLDQNLYRDARLGCH